MIRDCYTILNCGFRIGSLSLTRYTRCFEILFLPVHVYHVLPPICTEIQTVKCFALLGVQMDDAAALVQIQFCACNQAGRLHGQGAEVCQVP